MKSSITMILSVAALCIAFAAVAGCTGGDPFVGKWTYSDNTQSGYSLSEVITVNNGGTGTIAVSANGASEEINYEVKFTADFKWVKSAETEGTYTITLSNPLVKSKYNEVVTGNEIADKLANAAIDLIVSGIEDQIASAYENEEKVLTVAKDENGKYVLKEHGITIATKA